MLPPTGMRLRIAPPDDPFLFRPAVAGERSGDVAMVPISVRWGREHAIGFAHQQAFARVLRCWVEISQGVADQRRVRATARSARSREARMNIEETEAIARTWANGVQETLQAAVANAALPGAVVVVTGADAAAREIAAGTVSVHDDVPVGPNTMFRLMSMTKAFASVAALQLIEKERLTLDQEVASVLPAFSDLKVLGGFDEDTPRCVHRSSQPRSSICSPTPRVTATRSATQTCSATTS